MWLINTTTLELEAFTTCPVGRYAILSHTWEDQELDFDTFRSGLGRKRKGFGKIQKCCELARAEGFSYAWVDTCCIDKRSSTELSEAINSMYAWYAAAAVCYAYLADVACNVDDTFEQFVRSRWFTRGWTLQELLAPKIVNMYGEDWIPLGSRPELSCHIRSATGIDEDLLNGIQDLQSYSIAQRMSWVSKRNATRIEDIAYCLLGLFNVNMPLLYGEGEKAFRRLQETIIQTTDDETIFAWTGVEIDGTGLLVKRPAQFSEGATIAVDHGAHPRPSYTMTNRGLSMEFELSPYRMNTYVTPLRCCRTLPELPPQQIGIYLCRTLVDGQYRRISVNGVDLFGLKDERPAEAWPHDDTTVKTARIYIADTSTVALAPHGGLPTISFSQVQSSRTDAAMLKLLRQMTNWRRRPTTRLSREQPLERQVPNSRIDQQESAPSVPFDMERLTSLNAIDTTITLEDWKRGVFIEHPQFLLIAGFNSEFDPVCSVSQRWSRLQDTEFTKSFALSNQNATYSQWVGKLVLPIPGPWRVWTFKGHRSYGLEGIIVFRRFWGIEYPYVIILRRDPQAANGLTWHLKISEIPNRHAAVVEVVLAFYGGLLLYILPIVFTGLVLFMLQYYMVSTVQGVWALDDRDVTNFVAAILVTSVLVPFMVWGYAALIIYTLNKSFGHYFPRRIRGGMQPDLSLPTVTEAAAERIFAGSRTTEAA
ncbi:maturation of 5S rRNA [Exophiala xenobiotica]|uniref:Maturation of 5S rRNA n=1 Tax=Lithohypha guttulata TaxID=1690604 RepID=A0ABR0JVB6_9EURO|nr:maturation of 5S rRNA [Lithohypha guttulata]KAK5309754.1 maturation of 5S rRNA [Exophiala xenobiotica]